jgi:hypothetical protein
MTPKQIYKRVTTIKKNLKKYKDELIELQNICLHEDAIVEHKGSTGNYDPSTDGYWTEHHCLTCGKFWSVYK